MTNLQKTFIAVAATYFLTTKRSSAAPTGSGSGSADEDLLNISFLGMNNLPRGVRNNNPGNLKISSSAWQHKIPAYENTDGVFEQFETLAWGTRAMTKILINYISVKKLNTIHTIIHTYAPTSENNSKAYVDAVSNSTGFSPHQRLSPNYSTMKLLVQAMSRHENGRVVVPDAMFDTAWGLI